MPVGCFYLNINMAKNNKKIFIGYSNLFGQRRKYDLSNKVLFTTTKNPLINSVSSLRGTSDPGIRPKFLIWYDVEDMEKYWNPNYQFYKRAAKLDADDELPPLDEDRFTHLKHIYDSPFGDNTVNTYVKHYGKQVFEGNFEDYLELAGLAKIDPLEYKEVVVQIEHLHGYLALNMSFNRKLLSAIKRSIPGWQRRWCEKTKRWYIDRQHLSTLEAILSTRGIKYSLVGSPDGQGMEEKEFNVEFIQGMNYKLTHRRFTTNSVNTNFHRGFLFQRELFWFTHDSLYNYFYSQWLEENAKNSPQTYYQILGLKESCSIDQVKIGYRTMALKHHPDKGGNADDFIRVDNAYKVLSDKISRKKYDASLKFVRSREEEEVYRYEMKENCGRIKAKGYFWLGIFIVEEIVSWKPIYKDGRRLHSVFNHQTGNYEVKYQ